MTWPDVLRSESEIMWVSGFLRSHFYLCLVNTGARSREGLRAVNQHSVQFRGDVSLVVVCWCYRGQHWAWLAVTVLIAGLWGIKFVLCGNSVFSRESTYLPLVLSFKAEVFFKSLQKVWSNNYNYWWERVSHVAGTCKIFTHSRGFAVCLVCGVSVLLGVLLAQYECAVTAL